MKSIKIKYYLQHDETGNITYFIHDLKVIEETWIVFPKRMSVIARCLCTGVKTKSGLDIYEGDIWFDSNGTGVIVFHEGRFGIKWHTSGAIKDVIGDVHAHASTTSGNTVGNIYENPELLK